MAFIKRTTKSGLLIGWREAGKVVYGYVPDHRAFGKFCRIETERKARGEAIPRPETIWPRPSTSKEEPDPAETAQQPIVCAPPELPVIVPSASAGTDGDGSPYGFHTASFNGTSCCPRKMTLKDWIGAPRTGAHGPFFTEVVVQRNAEQERAYQSAFEKRVYPYLRRAADGADLLMWHVMPSDISALVREWLVCPSCRARAEAAGRPLPPERLSVEKPPWDSTDEEFTCVDDEGESTHFARWSRQTLDTTLGMLRTVFRFGMNSEAPVCSKDPAVEIRLPNFAEPTRNDELAYALEFAQLELLGSAMPIELEATIYVSAFGLLRLSELFGLSRGDFELPSTDGDDIARLVIRKVYVKEPGRGYGLRHWGKTPGSTFPIPLAAPGTRALRRHLELNRSTPSPERCSACAAGSREWSGGRGLNPHRACDFADDAPLFVDLDGKRMKPARFAGVILPEAVEASGLTKAAVGFKITHKVLRATGGTQLLLIGVHEDVVKRMGRWTNIETLKRHYVRLSEKTLRQAAEDFGQAAAIAAGLLPPEAARPEVALQAALARIATLEAEVARLTALCDEAHISTDRPITRPPLRRTVVSVFDDEARMRSAISGAASQTEALALLGLSQAGKNYKRLRSAAEALGLVLPPKFETLRTTA